ncbi:MAG: hypothetical protein GF400_07250 [Candidatus Eisenbacteria bacterium]|nr:hypothetical protein [Candidatus Eisenbacteria bacterium]
MPGGRSSRLIMAAAVALAFTGSGASAALERPKGQALQMQIEGVLNLEGFGSTSLAYQRSVSPTVAWRVEVSADASRSTEDEDYLYHDGSDVDQAYEDTIWDHKVSVACEWLRYSGEDVAFYCGGGPWFEYSSFRSVYRGIWQDNSDEWVDTVRSFGGGLRGCLGVQWTAREWLAVHAEYGAVARYSLILSDREQTVGSEQPEYSRASFDRRTFALESEGVRFGVSVYF